MPEKVDHTIYVTKYMSCCFCQRPAPFKGKFFMLKHQLEVSCMPCKKHIEAEKENPGSVKVKKFRKTI